MGSTTTRTAWLLLLLFFGIHEAFARLVDVGVVDDLIDATHPALAGRAYFAFPDQPVSDAGQIFKHGTKVASVIVRNTGPYVRVGSVGWDAAVYKCWYPVRNKCLADGQACGPARHFLETEFRFYAKLWRLFPIVNSSHGLAERQTDGRKLEDALVHQIVPQLKETNGALWANYTQADRKADARSIHVRSTGNTRAEDGRAMVNFHRLLFESNPELWDHTLFVTALDPSTGHLVDGVHACGPLPRNWKADEVGRHFCVAAPGVHCVAAPGGGCEDAAGSSYAAPYVAAILAEMHMRCGFGGPALLKLLLDNANRGEPYNDIETYGAGVVTMEGALRACTP